MGREHGPADATVNENGFPAGVKGVVWDWGDTLMRDLPGQAGPMVDWPRVEAMPGASRALAAFSFCSAQCVATNATESDGDAVSRALARVGLRDHLTHFVTSSELGRSKPDPAFFRAVARLLAFPPASLVAVGNDYRKDIAPAKAAGMATVWVSPAAGLEGLEAADLVVPDLHHLADHVQHWTGSTPQP